MRPHDGEVGVRKQRQPDMPEPSRIGAGMTYDGIAIVFDLGRFHYRLIPLTSAASSQTSLLSKNAADTPA